MNFKYRTVVIGSIKLISIVLLILSFHLASCSRKPEVKIINIDKGWASNSINTVIFRRNSVVSHNNIQYAAYYDSSSFVVLAKRSLDSTEWEIKTTDFKGNIKDAHNSISIMVDGKGYLHMVWDEHNSELHYCRSVKPESLDLVKHNRMIGVLEKSVTYPEFHKLVDGNLIFVYRNGESGRGNLVMNHYDCETQTWTNLHQNLIDGEEKRSAYWQLYIDFNQTVHLSWVWRETWDVETNHDICYAKSIDGGKSWQKSSGEDYILPINKENAEYAAIIPQGSELINQTSICSDNKGNPIIANYWTTNGSDIPQYNVVYHNGNSWKVYQVSEFKNSFTLKGGGTKQIPISRPLILCNRNNTISLLFRAAERGNKVSMYRTPNIVEGFWEPIDLLNKEVGSWEPTFDTQLWKKSNKLHLFIQKVGQGDKETLENMPPQMVSILEMEG